MSKGESTFTTEGLSTALAPRPVRYFEQVSSSNDAGLDWLDAGAVEGAVVVADEQTRGRGRLGRKWYAPPGTALMLSYLLRPPMKLLPRMGMLAALAVCETVEALGVPNLGVKWPNDVQVKRLKVCGILPEARWQGGNLVGVVLGIGVNIRIDFENTPFSDSATSLETVLSRPLDRVELLAVLLARLDYWRARLGDEALFLTWRTRLTTLRERVAVVVGANVVHGIAEDVDADGALLVRDPEGVLQRVMAGDIALG